MPTASIDTLNEHHAVPDHVRFRTGPGGLPVAEVTGPGGTATVSLQGGQVLEFQPTGEEPVLWMSPEAVFETDHAIRGGVPVCWPWFGEAPGGGRHGIVRDRPFAVRETARLMDGREACLCLGLVDDETTRERWPHAFDLQVWITVGSRLRVEVLMINTDVSAISVSSALHAYFRVGDIDPVSVKGVKGLRFLDKTTGFDEKVQEDLLTVEGEVDRIYLDPPAEVVLDDEGLGRRLRLTRLGGDTLVAWNPGQHKAREMADFADAGYREMLCLEPALGAARAIEITPGEERRFGFEVGVEPLD